MKDENNSDFIKSKSSAWDEGAFIIFFAIVILIPIVFYPYGINMFNPPKELLLQILSIIALSIWGLRVIVFNKINWKSCCFSKPIFFYLIVGCLSLIWSINIYHSISALPLFIAGPLLYYLITNLINEQVKIERILLAIILMGIVMGIYGILQYMGIDFRVWSRTTGRGRMFGLLGNVNYFAEYLILPLSLTMGLIISRKNKFHFLFLLGAVAIIGSALILTFTRSSYLAMAVSIPLMLFLSKKYCRWITKKVLS